MEREEFNELLEKAKLTKKEFANIIEMQYSSVNNWGSSQQVPRWVKTWLENYIKAEKFNNIKDKIVDIL